MGYTSTRVIIKWWHPIKDYIGYSTSITFNEQDYKFTNGTSSPGSLLQQQ